MFATNPLVLHLATLGAAAGATVLKGLDRGVFRAFFAVLAIALLLHAADGHAATELRTLIDSDGNPATGCTVTTPAGTFEGADLAAVTRIDVSASEPVGDVSREICQAGALVTDPSFTPLAPLRWPVGVGAAGVQRDVVESYIPFPSPPGAVRLAFMAGTTDGSIAPAGLLSVNGSPAGGAIQLVAPSVAGVPGLGVGGLLLAALLVVWITYRFAPVRRIAAGGAALGLLLVVGLAWAAIVRDGDPSDWSTTPPIATSSAGVPLQFAAVYARIEGGTLQLRYDLDLGLRDGAPRDDGTYNTTVGVALPVVAPGVLANDVPGSPSIQVNEFRVQGDATTVPAGGAVPFAGSTLQVNPDGAFTVGAPTMAGLFRFEYRARNRFFPGGWGVATVAVAPAGTCGDGTRGAGEVCDDGNTVNETSCSYGSPTCTTCNATCSALLSLTGPYCGDSTVNGPEVCDDGNTTDETSCPYGTASCTTCNSTCSGVLTLTGPYCGDGKVNGSEVCDDGNTTDETSCPYGAASCTTCNSTCSGVLTLAGPYCGDGVVSNGEVCDDGNTIDETSCPLGAASCTTCNSTCSATINL
jgi:hypothetical protein